METRNAGRGAKVPPGLTKVKKYINFAAVASIVLHGAFVLLHIALFVVYSHRYEHHITASWNKWIPAAITMVSEAFGTVYLAILVLLVQRLSLVRDLFSRQTLTAIHDKNNAWLGVVSAITTAFQQRSIPAAPFGVVMIAAYLANVLVLHITVPSLLHFIPTNRTIVIGYPTNVSDAIYDFDVYSAWDVLPVYDQLPTRLGLQDNMVYDVIPAVPSAVGTTRVNASLYTVSCAPVLSPLGDQSINAETRGFTYTYQIDNFTSISIDPGTLNYGTMLVHRQSKSYSVKFPNPSYSGPTGDGFNSSNFWSPFLISSTVPFVSKTGELLNDNWIPLIPAVGYQLPPDNNNENSGDRFSGDVEMAFIPAIQLLTCALNLTYTFVDVDASTQKPVSMPQLPPSSETTPWWYFTNQYPTPPDARFVSAIAAEENAPLDSEDSFPRLDWSWALLWNTSRPASVPTVYPAHDPAINNFLGMDFQIIDGEDSPTQATVLDIFLSRELGLMTSPPAENVSILALESAFGKALAARYWYGRNLNFSDPHETFKDPLAAQQDLSKNYTITTKNGTAMINQIVEEGELDLNLIPLIAGTASSIALFCISIYFVHVSRTAEAAKNTASELKGAGVLQLAWLLSNEPELASVGEPEIEALRKAGMYYLRLSEMAQERVRLGREVEASKERETAEANERETGDVNEMEVL